MQFDLGECGMNLKQLEYFLAVCQFKNMTRAAEHLHISQPSITMSIKSLEDDLGVTLIDRRNKKIEITVEGLVLKERAINIMNRIEDTEKEIRDYGRQKKRMISIGIPPMIGSFLFPKIFIEFSNKFPNVILKAYENGSLETRKLLEDGEIDLAFIILESYDQTDSRSIFNTQVQFCVNKHNPLSRHHEINIKEINQEPIIMLKEGFYHNKVIKDRFMEAGVRPNIIYSSNQLDTIKSFVENNVGSTFLIKEIVKNEEDIVSIPLSVPIEVNIGLVWNNDRYLPHIVKELIDFIRTTTCC
jgi:DNA-binding transcriptional LysR family regulator